MRLINTITMELEEFFESNTPEYAILSHTWAKNEEEVSLQQFQQPHSAIKRKPGYRKIQQACRTAFNRGFVYVWVDTCCIDKTSSAELSEAINSMFRWYQDAELCIAYLVDVLPSTSHANQGFEESRWFTRGWTLQELIAPKVLDFFASDWSLIASRQTLAADISRITRIDQKYLTGSSMENARIAEKMSWASDRQTSRTEDLAYCLLGVFGVNMPLIYGEGTKAFQRLQEEIVRNVFDPTILAWNTTDQFGDALLPEPPASCPVWLSALKMLMLMDHPWCSSSQPENVGNGVGHFSKSSDCFLHCKDIAPFDANVDGALTTQGLEITLPISQNADPYAIIPCRFRNDPLNLIAIPLKPHGDNTYSRACVPHRLVSHHKYHQWPLTRVTLKIKAQSDLAMTEKLPRSMWVRRLPDTVKLLGVWPSGGAVSEGMLVPVMPAPHFWNRKISVALFLEHTKMGEKFAAVLEVREPFGVGRVTLWDYESFCCHFTPSASHEMLHSLLGSMPRLGRGLRWLISDECVLYARLTQERFMDHEIFDFELKETTNIFLHFRAKLSNASTWVLYNTPIRCFTHEAPLFWMLHGRKITSELFVPVILITLLIHIYSLATTIPNHPITKITEKVVEWTESIPFFEISAAVSFMHCLAPVTYYFIGSMISPSLRDYRWAQSFVLGILFALMPPPSLFLFCLLYVKISLLSANSDPASYAGRSNLQSQKFLYLCYLGVLGKAVGEVRTSTPPDTGALTQSLPTNTWPIGRYNLTLLLLAVLEGLEGPGYTVRYYRFVGETLL